MNNHNALRLQFAQHVCELSREQISLLHEAIPEAVRKGVTHCFYLTDSHERIQHDNLEEVIEAFVAHFKASVIPYLPIEIEVAFTKAPEATRGVFPTAYQLTEILRATRQANQSTTRKGWLL